MLAACMKRQQVKLGMLQQLQCLFERTYSNQLSRCILLAITLLNHLLRSNGVAVVHASDIDIEHILEIFLGKV
jgi:hypothetical protein